MEGEGEGVKPQRRAINAATSSEIRENDVTHLQSRRSASRETPLCLEKEGVSTTRSLTKIGSFVYYQDAPSSSTTGSADTRRSTKMESAS